MMNSFKITYYSATSMEFNSISKAYHYFKKEEKENLEIIVRGKSQLMNKKEVLKFTEHAKESQFVIMNLHGGQSSCPGFDLIMEEIKKIKELSRFPYVLIFGSSGDDSSLDAASKYSDFFEQDIWIEINKYISFGGPVNFKNLFKYLISTVDKDCNNPQPPKKQPNEGLYHPDFSSLPSIQDYLEQKIDKSRPTIGIWFYQGYWLNGELSWVDALIHEIEHRGANVICVFHKRFQDSICKNKGADYVVEKFFMKNGNPIIDVLINPMMFSLNMLGDKYNTLYKRLDCAIIQVIMSLISHIEWDESVQGLSPMEICCAVAQPEFDGAYITVPIAFREEKFVDPLSGALLSKYEPCKERMKKIVDIAINYAKLKKKQNIDKRVAIIFHNYPPRNDRIGCAAGLDSFESVKILLDRLKEQGYKIDRTYKSGDELAKEILSSLTYDKRWILPEQLCNRCKNFAPSNRVGQWIDALPIENIEKLKKDWGDVPGELFVFDNKMFFPGIINGNIFITIQPMRGSFEKIDSLYHDPYLSPPYNYIAHYKWIRDEFKADAVIHVGKHGSLEWLPGKSVGLSNRCWPDIAIMDLPNIYPYIINDPSEGTQAKRRSYCCIIDHLTPAFTNADLHEDLGKLDNLLKEYSLAKVQDKGKIDVLKNMIWDSAKECNILSDLSMDDLHIPEDFESFLKELHSYLSDLENNIINDGLHILGIPPKGERLIEYLVQLTKLSNGDVPSLREVICDILGYDYNEVIENKGTILNQDEMKTGRDILQQIHNISVKLVTKLHKTGFDKTKIGEIVKDIANIRDNRLPLILEYICDLSQTILKTYYEIENTIHSLNGGFVPPGPSGAPTRGQAHILPTGRNFYSVDPQKIPTPAAWEIGKRLGNELIRRYLNDTGKYPETIGIIVWGGPVMRTGGDDIAEILYLLGVRPVWARGSMEVKGLEIIPLSELGRPRLDVVPRISGFFRDAFPNLIELLDNAVKLVANLKEDPSENILRKNVLRDVEMYKSQGLNQDQAFLEATIRVFGCPPGSYGAGVAELVESGEWENHKDLGDIYIAYSSYSYGKDNFGKKKEENFRQVLSRMDVAVKNEDSREYDMMSCTDFYNYFGGLIVASKSVRGKAPSSYVGDSSDPQRINMRSTEEEAKFIIRSRITNPKWINGMKRHGYKGASDISKMMDVILGWDATADVMEDWMYEKVAEKLALDDEIKQWMKEKNPYALHNIISKLLEAANRHMWKPKDKTHRQLMETYLEIEGEIEELTD